MSLFQHYPTNQKRVCLSFGIERAILQGLSEEVEQEAFEKLITESYALVHPPALVVELKPMILARIYSRIEELKTPPEPTKKRKTSKSFGTSFAEWLGGLDATETCLYLADFDIEKALAYYWEEDYVLVQEAVKVKSAQSSQMTLVQLEACMYGFGGKYADDQAGENVIDLTDPGAKEALSAFGF